jgi:hypothetical protein
MRGNGVNLQAAACPTKALASLAGEVAGTPSRVRGNRNGSEAPPSRMQQVGGKNYRREMAGPSSLSQRRDALWAPGTPD